MQLAAKYSILHSELTSSERSEPLRSDFYTIYDDASWTLSCSYVLQGARKTSAARYSTQPRAITRPMSPKPAGPVPATQHSCLNSGLLNFIWWALGWSPDGVRFFERHEIWPKMNQRGKASCMLSQLHIPPVSNSVPHQTFQLLFCRRILNKLYLVR